ncbi:MAG: Crp/Fnr family transcriptional regulator [Chitinivibrionales bacterium]
MDHPIWSYFFGPPKENKAMVELLKALPVFDGVSNKELIQIERGLHQRRYKKGETVFEEGMPGAGMYIIKEGEITIRKKAGEENDIELASIPQRSFFGEIALLDDIPRSASAVAACDSILLALPQPYLEELRDRNPKLAIKIITNIARLVSRRLVKANSNLEEMQQRIKPGSVSQADGELKHASAS